MCILFCFRVKRENSLVVVKLGLGKMVIPLHFSEEEGPGTVKWPECEDLAFSKSSDLCLMA